MSDHQPPETTRKLLSSDVEPQEGRLVKFTVTMSVPDRERDVVESSGADLENFRRNPVIQWAHMYSQLPIGRAVEILPGPTSIQMVIEFATADLNPMADQVYRLIKAGFLRACSIGFRPLEWAYDETRKGYNYLRWELLEVSVCPVPALPGALVSASAAADLGVMKDWAQRALTWVEQAEAESETDVVGKGVSPKDVSKERAPEGEAWKAPKLADFTDQTWDEMDAAMKRKVAGHFAWCAEMPPAAFASCKLPHHRASDGKVVWRGVVAAVARLGATDLPSDDVGAVKAHLAKHFLAFRPAADLPDALKGVPWERDDVGWKAYAKAAQRAQRKAGDEPVAETVLADLLEDFGFDAEAEALRVVEPDEKAMPPAPVEVVVVLDDVEVLRHVVQSGDGLVRLAVASPAHAVGVSEPVPPDVEAAIPAARELPAVVQDAVVVDLCRRSGLGLVTREWMQLVAGKVAAAHELVDATLASTWVKGEGIAGEANQDGWALLLRDEDADGRDYAVVLEAEVTASDDERYELDAELVGVAMREALSDLVGRETRAAINALRGRID